MPDISYPPCPAMPEGRDIIVTPTISTCHIPFADNNILSDLLLDIPYLYARHEYGWEFSLCGFEGETRDGAIQEVINAGLSETLVNLLCFFKGLGYHHLNIDRDGDVLEGLHKFEW